MNCPRSSALCALLHAKDHLGDGQLDPARQSDGLLKFIFQSGHLEIKRRAVKLEIRPAGTLFFKGPAARAMANRSPGLLKFVGDAVQPAYHGTIGIKAALAVLIQRAHQPPCRTLPLCLGSLAAHRFRLCPYGMLSGRRQRIQPFLNK